MYSVIVPVSLGYSSVEDALSEVQRVKADRVLVAMAREMHDTPDGRRIDYEGVTARLAGEIARYQNAGIDTGAWLGETVGHGALCKKVPNAAPGDRGGFAYQPFVSINGVTCFGAFCVADPLYRRDFAAWAAASAKAGASLVLLDDDFRMSSHGDSAYAGCLCDAHVKRFCEMVGEDLTREEIARRVFTGPGSRYRDCWQKLMGGDLLQLARDVRAAIDEVNPACRAGICGVSTTVDLDGATYVQLSDALAGPSTRPYLRLLGAPYWAKDGSRLAVVASIARMTAKFAEEWQQRTDAEVVFEGDIYPHPRFCCPAAYLEMTDLIMRAEPRVNGAMKYVMNYPDPLYECGYADASAKNIPLAKEVEAMFAGKRQCGLRPLEYQHLFRDEELCDDPCEGNLYAYHRFNGSAIGPLSFASAPISFDDGVPVVFGENARQVPPEAIAGGAILDAQAAEILTMRGFDVGAAGFGSRRANGGHKERDCRSGEVIGVGGSDSLLREIYVKPGAVTESELQGRECPVYTYENADGARFAVFPVIADPEDRGMFFRNYLRQQQMVRFAEWIGRAPLDAVCVGQPNLYILTAKDERETAVGLWNLFEDVMIAPHVTLSREPESVTFVNCTGRVEGRDVVLSDIDPFAFAGFTWR